MSLIYFLIIYIPLETFLLKWIPVSDGIYQIATQLPDILIMFLFISLCVTKRSSFRIIGHGIDKYLLLFIFFSISAVVINFESVNHFSWVLSVKALLRYILLIYCLLNMSSGKINITKIYNLSLFSFLLQLIAVSFHLVGGEMAENILAARNVESGIADLSRIFTGGKFEDLNRIFGTFGNTVSLGYFLLYTYVIMIVRNKSRNTKYYLTSVIIFMLIYYTGSRGCMLAHLILFATDYFRRANPGSRLISLIIVAVAGWIGYLALPSAEADLDTSTVASLFTSQYIETALNQRLGVIVYIVPDIIKNPTILFGTGTIEPFLDNYIIGNNKIPSILVAVLELMFEDVYWIALLTFHGFPAMLCFVVFLRKVYLMLYNNASMSTYILAPLYLMIIMIPLNFLNQAFATRSFSFFMWLSIGIAIMVIKKAREMDNENIAAT